MTHREEIDVIYGEYAKTSGFMNADNLLEFLLKEQREEVSLTNAQKLIEKYELDENGKSESDRGLLTVFVINGCKGEMCIL